MSSQPSLCPACGEPGRYGFDDDWCHDSYAAAVACPREGWYPGCVENAVDRWPGLENSPFPMLGRMDER